jgi:hypothetical protein
MKQRLETLLLLAFAVVLPAAAMADDLTNSGAFLCAAQSASVCTPEGECVSGTPGSWNIPQFILVDLDAKRLATTKASGQRRSTPIANTQRKDGVLFVQGIEMGRAFSIQIDEETGDLSAAVAREGLVVAVFGACTPTPERYLP